MKRILQIANPIALIATVIINYTASTGLINNQTIGEVSAQYPTLVTPAGYAFSIWGMIYLMLAGFAAYQARGLFKPVDDDDFVLQIGWWFAASCLFNSLWVITWVCDMTGLSVLMMSLLLISLLKIIINTNMERWDAPFPKILLLWWPFCLYSGWVAVAIIPNIAAWLTKMGWNGFDINDPVWAVIMIIIAGAINVYMIWSRNMREFALTGCWALVAIAVTNWNIHDGIVATALITAAVMFINTAVHGSQNQDTAPHIKWKEMKAADKGLFD